MISGRRVRQFPKRMSNIRYKFRNDLEYKTLQFDGLHITVEEVKEAIFAKENINRAVFDLEIINQQTQKVYGGDGGLNFIPRNSSVVVKRVPPAERTKIPKVQ